MEWLHRVKLGRCGSNVAPPNARRDYNTIWRHSCDQKYYVFPLRGVVRFIWIIIRNYVSMPGLLPSDGDDVWKMADPLTGSWRNVITSRLTNEWLYLIWILPPRTTFYCSATRQAGGGTAKYEVFYRPPIPLWQPICFYLLSTMEHYNFNQLMDFCSKRKPLLSGFHARSK